MSQTLCPAYKDQINPVAELYPSGALKHSFIYGEYFHVPSAIESYAESGQLTGKYRIASNHLGSVTRVIKADTGEIVQDILYDAWGNVLGDSNPRFQPFYFAGGIYDEYSKLTRFGARDYDAQVGRWTTKDPIGFEGGLTSFYDYVGGDPVNYLDITGLDSISAKLLSAIGRGDTKGIRNLVDAVGDPKLQNSARKALEKFESKASDWIAKHYKGKVNNEFPSQFRDKTLEEIKKNSFKNKDYKKSWKLLNDKRFQK